MYKKCKLNIANNYIFLKKIHITSKRTRKNLVLFNAYTMKKLLTVTDLSRHRRDIYSC